MRADRPVLLVRCQVRGLPRLIAVAALSLSAIGAAAVHGATPVAEDDLPPEDAGSGLIVEDPADIERAPKVERYRSWLPVSRDLSALLPPPGNQGRSETCTGWAVGYAARSYHLARDTGADPRLKENIASPAAVYASIVQPRGDCKRGSKITRALNLLQQTGVPSLADTGFEESRCDQVVSAEHAARAERFRIKSWAMLADARAIDDVKGELAKGSPVILSMRPSADFKRHRGGIYRSTAHDAGTTGHAVTLVGYDEQRGAFKLINSWGRRWGDGGYAWISYDAYRALARHAFIMRTAAEVPPAPRPDPPRPDPPPENVPRPPVAVGKPPAALLSEIAARFTCAGGSIDGAARRIAAFVGAGEDLEAYRRALQGALPDHRIEIEVRPWPECEARATFAEPLGTPQGLQVSIDGHAGAKEASLKEGDPFVVRIRSPAFRSYVYVAYLQAAAGGVNEAIHLVQPQGTVFRQIEPGTEMVFGDGSDGGPRFTVSEPYGRELVVVIAAASPLFRSPRAPRETERSFLSEFRAAMLQQAPGGGAKRVAAAIVPLITSARQVGAGKP